MLGNYLQQTTSADVMFQMHFFLGALRVNTIRPGQVTFGVYKLITWLLMTAKVDRILF